MTHATASTCITTMLVALAFFGGCGKKAPPVAPRQPAMQAVSDLNVHYQNPMVTLRWHHRPTGSAATGYAIYRASQSSTKADCTHCPLLFEKIDRLNMDPALRAQQHPLTYSQSVGRGNRYVYKVVPVQSSGAQGPDSNLVVVDAVP